VRADGRHSFLSRPPDIHPLGSAGLGMFFILCGMAIQGSFGGAIAGGGLGCVVIAAWDAFRTLYLAGESPPNADDSLA
jgi:hypothetical protein